MKKTILSIVLATLCLILKAQEQQFNPGTPIPENLWKAKHAYLDTSGRPGTMSLDAYKGKLIILDYWATWCSACIEGFAKVQQLQQQFPDQIKIILVTNENQQKIQTFLTKQQQKGEPVTLPTIIADTLLAKSFPHQGIPHYVWISKDAKLAATTSTREITYQNVKDLLENKPSKMEQKIDMDKEKLLYTASYLPSHKLQQYSILLKGYLEGLGAGTTQRKTNNKITGYLISNYSIRSLYEHSFFSLDKYYSPRQLKIQVAKPELLEPPAAAANQDEWYRYNSYTLDFNAPEDQAQNLNRMIINYLNTYSPYHASIDTIETECLVLYTKGSTEKLRFTEGKIRDQLKPEALMINGRKTDMLVTYLNNELYQGYPAVDESNYPGKINLTLPLPITNIDSLRKQLQVYGLDVKKAKRRIAQYQIKDKPSTTLTSNN